MKNRAYVSITRTAKFALSLVVLSAICVTLVAADGGNVLPPDATPHGYSLDNIASVLALFDTSGNNLQFYPKTPFQILFQDPSKFQSSNITCPNGGQGFLLTGGNTFVVSPGTEYFVPLFTVDDSQPVLGVWPTEKSEAADYFFGAENYGDQNLAIVVDGNTTPVGADFLGGPVETPPLLDGGGTHLIQLGVFLKPLRSGTHTVTIQGGVFGSGVLPTYGFSCEQQDFTYVVKVVPGSK